MVYVIRHHLASVLSLSLASAEGENLASSLRRYHRAILAAGRAGGPVTMVAATGDLGAAEVTPDGRLFRTPQVGWPASDPLVVAVGGTQPNWAPRRRAIRSRRPPPGRAATGAGPRCSRARRTRARVAGVAGRRRAVPDISLDASPRGRPGDVRHAPFDRFPPADKWTPNYGTSLATPLFAGVVALAGQLAGRPLGLINPLLYQLAAQHDPGIMDIQGQGNTFHAGHIDGPGLPGGPGL